MGTAVVFNLEDALARVEGDQELFLTLVELFLQESPKESAAIRTALACHDSAGLTAAAHKLKGSVLQFCAPRLYETTKRLEELGRQGDLAGAAPVCTTVEKELAELHAAFRQVVAAGVPS